MTAVNKASSASVPITQTTAHKDSIELKKEYVLFKAKTQADNMRQSVADYHKRMAEFQKKRVQQLKQTNNDEIKKRISNIQNRYFGNDVSKLLSGSGDIDSLMFFANCNQFDSSLESALYTAKKQKSAIQEKITKLQNGENDGSEVKVDPDLKDFTNRDLLA